MGRYQRFSSASNTIKEIFLSDDVLAVERKLRNVVRTLTLWIETIDSLVGKHAEEITISDLLSWMMDVIDQIKEDCESTKLDFSYFRLSVFTSLVCGLGIPKPGKHLHHIFFPMEDTAALNHLRDCNRYRSEMVMGDDDDTDVEKKKADICWNEVDELLKYLSGEINCENFCRSQMEVLLCGSSVDCKIGYRSNIFSISILTKISDNSSSCAFLWM